jgi:hypothetical protein
MAQKKSLSSKTVKHHHFLLAGVIAFFAAGAILAGALLVAKRSNGDFGGKLHVFEPGKVISNMYYDVRVDSATRSQGAAGSVKLVDGREYLVVDIYVKNKTTKNTELYPLTQTYIKDESGQIYNIGPASIDQPFPTGVLSPGDEAKGKVAYEIPKGLKSPKFYFEGLASKPVVVELN